MPPPPPDPRIEFLKLEYEAVIKKMSELRADLGRAETIYPLAMAAIYVWMFTKPAAVAGLWAAALLAPLIGALGFLRILTRQKNIALLEGYCCKLEREFYDGEEPRGWEHVYGDARPMKFFAVARLWLGGFILAASAGLSSYALYDPAAFQPPEAMALPATANPPRTPGTAG